MENLPLPQQNSILMFVILLWVMFWKGISLWNAAQNKQRNWFIVLLIINTLGILELVYLFRFAKKRLTWQEIKSWKYLFVDKIPEKK